MSDLKSKILDSFDCVVQEVFVPEWDVTVFVRSMSGKDKDAFDESITEMSPDGTKKMNLENFRAKLLVKSLCTDQTGKELIFSEEDIPAVSAKNADVLVRLYGISAKLNGMVLEEEIEKK